jgi:hypothetical protein
MLKTAAALLMLFIISCGDNAVQQEKTQSGQVKTQPTLSPEDNAKQVVGQTIYVPIYSHIYIRDRSRVINVTATLSIRNTDSQHPIRINAVRYYGSNGEMVKDYTPQPFRLGPMASTEYVVEENDTIGGAGANFIVEWSAGTEVTVPVVEAVMISTVSQQGISFISAGRVIKDQTTKPPMN